MKQEESPMWGKVNLDDGLCLWRTDLFCWHLRIGFCPRIYEAGFTHARLTALLLPTMASSWSVSGPNWSNATVPRLTVS
jgi:hypothetical protein